MSSNERQAPESGRVEFVTRYETKVHARNLNADYGTPVTVYATSKQDAVNKAVAVGWGGYPDDARVTIVRVTQEPVVIPPATTSEADQ